MLPNGWQFKELGKHIRIHSGVAPGQLTFTSDGVVPYVKVEDLNNCYKYQTKSREYIADESVAIPRNSIIFPKRGAAIFANKIRIAGRPLALDTNLMAVETLETLDPEFFYYAISYAGLHKLADTSPIPQLNNKHILPYRLPTPRLAEQRKIAEVLSLWDEAILKTENLLSNSKNQKRALINRILAGVSADKNWKTVKIGDITHRVTRRSESQENTYPILMISSSSGFIRQDEQYGRYMAGKSVENYVLLRKGEFAYNKGNSKRYEFGCIFPLENYKEGLVPHVYVCFVLRDGCDSEFYKHLFAADYLHDQLGGLVNTGVRNNGLLNIRPADFFTVKIPLPPIGEQRKIGSILQTATEEITCIEHNLEALRVQKRGLMQQLLVGKRCVYVDTENTAVTA